MALSGPTCGIVWLDPCVIAVARRPFSIALWTLVPSAWAFSPSRLPRPTVPQRTPKDPLSTPPTMCDDGHHNHDAASRRPRRCSYGDASPRKRPPHDGTPRPSHMEAPRPTRTLRPLAHVRPHHRCVRAPTTRTHASTRVGSPPRPTHAGPVPSHRPPGHATTPTMRPSPHPCPPAPTG